MGTCESQNQVKTVLRDGKYVWEKMHDDYVYTSSEKVPNYCVKGGFNGEARSLNNKGKYRYVFVGNFKRWNMLKGAIQTYKEGEPKPCRTDRIKTCQTRDSWLNYIGTVNDLPALIFYKFHDPRPYISYVVKGGKIYGHRGYITNKPKLATQDQINEVVKLTKIVNILGKDNRPVYAYRGAGSREFLELMAKFLDALNAPEEEKEVPMFIHVVDSIARVDTRYRFWSEFIVDPNKQKGWNNMLGK